MLVKHLIQILKKYKSYRKNLKELEENVRNGDDYLSKSDWAELYGRMYKDYIKFMNTPLDSLLEEIKRAEK